eukprot:gene3629-3891_t
MVVGHTQKDPGEYLSELTDFGSQSQQELRRYAIDMSLRRYDRALENLVAAGPRHFDAALKLAVDRGLLRQLLALTKQQQQSAEAVAGGLTPHQRLVAVLTAYGDWMISSRKAEDAAVTYTAAGQLDMALQAYKAAGAWRMAMYLGDLDGGVAALVAAREWREALRVAYAAGRDDLADTVIIPTAAQSASSLLEEANESIDRLVKYTARLGEERKERRSQPVRRSRRLTGAGAEFAELRDEEAVTYSDYEGGLDDILADNADIESMPEDKQEQFQEIRCGSTGRGSVYDSVAGITCHFCRQKKLCGEEGCPRCSRRSTTAECIGKSDCSRCHSATGRFCRACLLIRYGQTLEAVREEMASGTWLCPHCYEDEHPDEGWMCNSSICMKRRGYKPTGIAIYDAQQRGFPSVAHWLQAQLRKRGSGNTGDAAKLSSNTNSSQASAESSDAAATAATTKAVRQPSKAKQAAAVAGKASASKLQRSSSSADSSCGDADSSATAAAVEAPVTPMRGSEALTPAAAKRVTRAVVKAAAAAEVVSSLDCQLGGQEGGGEAKRACVGEGAGARRSLRFKSKQ